MRKRLLESLVNSHATTQVTRRSQAEAAATGPAIRIGDIQQRGRTVTGGEDPRPRRLPRRTAGAPGGRRRAGPGPAARRHDHAPHSSRRWRAPRRASVRRRWNSPRAATSRSAASPTPSAVADAVAAAGLLPSRDSRAGAQHRRLAAVRPGRRQRPTSAAWSRSLDAAIRPSPRWPDLPGRFLFGIDDGRGDVSGLGADVGVHLLGESAALLLAGRDTGVRLAMPTTWCRARQQSPRGSPTSAEQLGA